MRLRHTRLLLAAALAAGIAPVAAAAPASAATGLAPVARLYQGSLLMQSPVVAMDGSSRAIVVWYDFGGNGQQLLARVYDRGNWSAAEPLPRGLGNPGDYRLVMDRAGHATVSWKASTNGVNRIESVRRPPGGGWSAPEVVAEGPVNGYDLAVSPDGTVTAAWSEGNAQALRVKSRPAQEAWPAGAEAPGDRSGLDPDLALDANAAGAVLVLFARNHAGGRAVEAAERGPSGSWETTTLGAITSAAFTKPELALGDGGDAVAAWEHKLDGDATQVSAAHRPAGHAFGPAAAMASPESSAAQPGAAVTAGGEAVVAWRDGKEKVIRVARRSRGEAGWSAPATAGGAGASVAVVADDGERVHLNVVDSAAGGTPKWGMLDGGAFGGLQPVDPEATGMQASMAFDGQGNGMMVWLRLGRTADAQVSGFDVVARGIDGTPPDITALTTPPRMVAGETATFSVEGGDRFSEGAAAWDFGDGRGVAGATATHAYAAPGTYTGRVMLADRHGNAVTRTFTVDVVASGLAAPRPPGSGDASKRDRRKPVVRVSGLPSRVRASWLLRKPRITLRVDEPAAMTVRLRAGRTLVASGATAGRRSLRVRLSPTRAGRKRLRAMRAPLKLSVRVTARDLAGNVRTVERRVTVSR